eukprot:1631195-Pyramimonas_sp.AAC.1
MSTNRCPHRVRDTDWHSSWQGSPRSLRPCGYTKLYRMCFVATGSCSLSRIDLATWYGSG